MDLRTRASRVPGIWHLAKCTSLMFLAPVVCQFSVNLVTRLSRCKDQKILLLLPHTGRVSVVTRSGPEGIRCGGARVRFRVRVTVTVRGCHLLRVV